MIKLKKISFNHFLISFFLLIPIINQYKVFYFTNWEVFLMVSIVYWLLKKGFLNFKIISNTYCVFSIYLIVFVFISSAFLDNVGIFSLFLRIVSYLLSFLLIFVVVPSFMKDYEFAKKIYLRIILIICFVLILQLVLHYFLGTNQYFLIPNLQLNYNDGVSSNEIVMNSITKISSGYYFRPSSVFIEPAYFSLYSLPGIAIILFDESINKKNIIHALFITICCVLTTSSISLIGCGIIWCIFTLKRTDLWRSHLLWMITFIIVILPFAFYYLVSSEAVSTSINIKLNSLNDLSNMSSTSLRLLRGGYYFDSMQLFSKFFGVGYGNLTAYYYQFNLSLPGNLINQVSYMNGLFTLLCSFGLFGTLLYGIFLIKNYINGNKIVRILIVCLMIFMSCSDMFDSTFYYVILYFIVIAQVRNLNQREVNK